MPPKTTKPDDHSEPDSQVRLQKFLASSGLGSRRKCEEYITDGRVTIDGEQATDLGVKVDPSQQVVQLDGERIRPQKKRYYVLNKPPGYVCTNSDPAGRPLAVSLVPQDDTRLFTVGRLDENSRGLILVTNDGELAHRMAHPRFSLSRQYQLQVAGKPTPEVLKQLREGVYFSEGKFSVSRVRIVRGQGRSTVLEVELHQGRNRELRRMLARVGHKVMNLERVTFGPLKLGRLGLGKCRPLRSTELAELRELAGDAKKTKSPRGGKPAGKKSSAPKGPAKKSVAKKRPVKKKASAKPPAKKPKRKRTGPKKPGRK